MLPLVVPLQSLNVVAGEGGRPADPARPFKFQCAPPIDRKNEPPAHVRPSASCVVCRVALPYHCQATQSVLLCPPCQARYNAGTAVVKPRHYVRAMPRANPYPVVTPFSKSTSVSTVTYTYPDLPVSSPASSSLRDGMALDAADAYVSVRKRHGDSAPGQVCVRPGCGARLPTHVPGGMCAACARHTLSRPRGSPDLVRALRQGAMLSATRTIEGSNVESAESESEVELVYPEDISFVTRCAPTSSELKRNESEPVEDEDDELELVYPEDTAETMRTPPQKSQAKPPTTLREFFTGGLQSIPTLQDPAALADKSPPRRCRVPGCNEVLPPQTRMERCVKCSIIDWERRKLTSMDASYPLLSPSTDSLTTNTTTEEMQVTTALDEMSEVEDEDEPPSPFFSPSKSTGSEFTDDHGVGPIPGWDSDLTELSSSDIESESTSESDSDSDSGDPTSHGTTTSLTIHIPLLVNRLPPDSLLQKCGNKRCNIALPMDHRWKTCDPCRRAQRMHQGVRLENIRRSIVGIELLEPPGHLCRQRRSLSPEMHETDTILTPETSRPCSTKRCRRRIPLPGVYRWKTCVGCRARGRRKARRKRDAGTEQRALCQPEIVPRFPAHQNRVALLWSLKAQLKAFVEGQITYLRSKLHEDETLDGNSRQPKHVPMIFVFVGEYSIVTSQRDDDGNDVKPVDGPAALDAMQKEVSSIVLDLERALRTHFSPGEAFATDEGGLIMRFTCSLELIAQLRPLTTCVGPSRASTGDDDGDKNKGESRGETMAVEPPPKLPAVPLVKTLSGELEAVVVPDESHRLFHGRRTVIRYCMLG